MEEAVLVVSLLAAHISMSGPVSISVGSGGTRWIPGSPSTNATRGGDSSFGSITAKGGGAGVWFHGWWKWWRSR